MKNHYPLYLTETFHASIHQHSESGLRGIHVFGHSLVLARVSLEGPEVRAEGVEVLLLFRHLLLENCDHLQKVLQEYYQLIACWVKFACFLSSADIFSN